MFKSRNWNDPKYCQDVEAFKIGVVLIFGIFLLFAAGLGAAFLLSKIFG
jgi:hypothetical protein